MPCHHLTFYATLQMHVLWNAFAGPPSAGSTAQRGVCISAAKGAWLLGSLTPTLLFCRPLASLTCQNPSGQVSKHGRTVSCCYCRRSSGVVTQPALVLERHHQVCLICTDASRGCFHAVNTARTNRISGQITTMYDCRHSGCQRRLPQSSFSQRLCPLGASSQPSIPLQTRH